jgi:hypothetical protein
MLPAIAATAIERYTRPGDLVIDPICGIGTTLVEGMHLGRDAAGVEYEARSAQVAAANIAHARPPPGRRRPCPGHLRRRPLPPGPARRARGEDGPTPPGPLMDWPRGCARHARSALHSARDVKSGAGRTPGRRIPAAPAARRRGVRSLAQGPGHTRRRAAFPLDVRAGRRPEATSLPGRSSPAVPGPATPTCKAPSAPPPWPARRTPGTYLGAKYRRIATRRGPQKANVAVQHAMLTAIWHMGTTGSLYIDPGGDSFTRLNPERARNRAIHQLQAMGYHVTPRHGIMGRQGSGQAPGLPRVNLASAIRSSFRAAQGAQGRFQVVEYAGSRNSDRQSGTWCEGRLLTLEDESRG